MVPPAIGGLCIAALIVVPCLHAASLSNVNKHGGYISGENNMENDIYQAKQLLNLKHGEKRMSSYGFYGTRGKRPMLQTSFHGARGKKSEIIHGNADADLSTVLEFNDDHNQDRKHKLSENVANEVLNDDILNSEVKEHKARNETIMQQNDNNVKPRKSRSIASWFNSRENTGQRLDSQSFVYVRGKRPYIDEDSSRFDDREDYLIKEDKLQDMLDRYLSMLLEERMANLQEDLQSVDETYQKQQPSSIDALLDVLTTKETYPVDTDRGEMQQQIGGRSNGVNKLWVPSDTDDIDLVKYALALRLATLQAEKEGNESDTLQKRVSPIGFHAVRG